jgi:hypothetical protein
VPDQTKRPRRGQYDAGRHDQANALAAKKVLADPTSPPGLQEWASRFTARQATEGKSIPRCCLCRQPAFSAQAILCPRCHRKPLFTDEERKRISEARAARLMQGGAA